MLRTGSDFIAFYAAGKVATQAGMEKVFDLSLLRVEEEKILGFSILHNDVNPFVHPPFIVPLLAFFARWDYTVAFHLWALVLVVILAASMGVFLQYFPDLTPSGKVWLFLAGILFFSGFVGVMNGQDSAILLLGVGIWALGLFKDDERMAGLGLALTVIRPHVALLLAIPFLFKRRGVWWWFCAGGGVLALVSIWLIGVDGTEIYLKTLAVSAGGEGYKINEGSMVNVLGILHRMFPLLQPEISRWLGWGLYFAAFVGLCVAWARTDSLSETHLGVAIIVGILATPHLHYHDTVLILIPLFIAFRTALKMNMLTVRDVAPFLYIVSFVLLFSYSIPALKFFMLYNLLALLLIFYWRPEVFLRFGIKSTQ